jgi:putative flippase GtrA
MRKDDRPAWRRALRAIRASAAGRETVAYLLSGIATTLINVAAFEALYFLGVSYPLANAVALILKKAAGYPLEKFLVFKTRCPDRTALAMEILRYLYARAATMVLDYALLFAFWEWFGIPPQWGKILATVLVMAANYCLNKFHVYNKTGLGRDAALKAR